MYISANSIDDLLRPVLARLLRTRSIVKATRGATLEIPGVLLKIRNPRARLSRSITKGKIFSGLGELIWYLALSDSVKFISYYISQYEEETEDGKTVYGAYGPRLFNMRGQDQVKNALDILRAKPSSRRAVIQLFDAHDLSEERKEIPCTCTLQLLIRNKRLEMLASMRSNDVMKGLPHDVFTFTMLQEIFARTLGVEIGAYRHSVGSLHLYESDIRKAAGYMEEDWQQTVPMPPIPFGDPWANIADLVVTEERIREGRRISAKKLSNPGYWSDLVRLLQIYKYSKTGQSEKIPELKELMTSKVFNTYIQRREKRVSVSTSLEQLDIPFVPPVSEGGR